MNGDGRIHIAFCISANYLKYIQVTMRGIVDNNAENGMCVHVFTDSIPENEWRHFCKLFASESVEIRLHTFDDRRLQRLKMERFTVYAWYRILIPEMLADIDKVLYIDTDTVVVGDLWAAYDTDVSDVAIAAVLDDKCYDEKLYYQADIDNDDKYVCSGVILMNLDYWRRQNLTEAMIQWALDNADRIVYPDQDTINHVCVHRKKLLPLKYGITQRILLDEYFYQHYPEEVVECLTQPVIVHYNSTGPWYRECQHPLLGYWDRYNAKLGRNKASIYYQYLPSIRERAKTRLWFALHPNVPRFYGGWETMLTQISRHGIKGFDLERLKNGL